MLKIGDFSRISQVSVKTIRFYAECGLLKPAQVDEFTGYRYYDFAQLARLNRILALKELGLSLEQIGKVLAKPLPAEQLRGMLVLKRAEIEDLMAGEQTRLTRVENMLKQIEQEGDMPDYEVLLKKDEPMLIASIRGNVESMETMPAWFYACYGELFGVLGQQGIMPSGSPMGIYHDTEMKMTDMDVEVAVPLSAAVHESGRVKVRKVEPAATIASTIHNGGYDSIAAAYNAIGAWIDSNGYRICGPARELYFRGPGMGEPETYVTEIQFPVMKAE